ncbi:hypothetical protein [Streptomyces sp. NPDC008150]|uniref:hypothetical protein n=1 Tax=Streptomyces sp. NPDC008150 TaxID=3364816 RepID=UPI0036E91F19
MLVTLTFAPVDGPTETVTADIPPARYAEMRDLIGTPDWTNSEAVAWIWCRTKPSKPMRERLFRLARITAIEPASQP